jgi:hypothetical protein
MPLAAGAEESGSGENVELAAATGGRGLHSSTFQLNLSRS